MSVGGPRQRALLALLLCNANRVVSRDQLLDDLLPDHAVRSPERMLRVWISRLRTALADGQDEPRLISRAPGYLLRVEAGELDLERFEALSQEGRAALEREDPEQAALLLREAQGLWRGRPLVDLEFEPFARVEVQRLEELRVLSLEDRIDAELALGRHADLCPELASLAAEYPLRERLRGQLMLALYRSGRQADALAVYRQTSDMLREELGLDPGRTLQELERSILQQDDALEPDARVLIAIPDGSAEVCPFKGLESFDIADAKYFCGRELLAAELLARAAESSLVGILGASGVGKSSLLRAGVLAALARGELPGSAAWRHLLVRPGERPHRQLRRALGGERLEAVLAGLAPGERLVIAVDQLEELFTSCDDEDERAGFLEMLSIAASDVQQRALVLVALRGDFYARFASYARFAELLSSRHVLVGPMGRAELAEAIEQPAARAGLEIERPLVEELVSHAAGQSGGLPLLSAMLVELWQARDGRVLRYESYRASGALHAAVARLAEAAYGRLGTTQQHVARTVMLRLAGDQAGTLVRRRAPVAELDRIDGANPVVSALINGRLLTLSDGRVELSHEALLHEWPRYRAWLDEDRAGRRLHGHLSAAAAEWEAGGRDPAELYRGARLTSALDWDRDHGDRVNAVEREFLDSSHLESEREARQQRVQNRRLRGLVIGVGALLAIAVAAGIIAVTKQQSASNEARGALARRVGAQAVNEPRLDVAMLLAREAVKLDRSPQTEGTLLATLQRDPAVIGAFALPISLAPQLALSPDGRTIAVSHSRTDLYGFQSGRLGEIRFYDTRTHRLHRTRLADFFGSGSPVYSRDGSRLAYPTAAAPPSIMVRDAHTLAVRAKLTFDPLQTARLVPDVAHESILFSPSGRTVYCAYRVFDLTHTVFRAVVGATYLARWSLPSGRRLSTTRLGTGSVLAWRPIADGRRLLIVDARRITHLDAGSLRQLSSVSVTPAPSAPSAATISPDGRRIVIGSRTGHVTFVDAATGHARPGAGPRMNTVTTVTFAPDGLSVLSTANTNTMVVWNPRTARATQTLVAPAQQVQSAVFGPDSRTLSTSSLGGLLLNWDLTGRQSFGRRFSLGARSPCCGAASPLAPPLALSPDGTTFAVRVRTSTVALFSARTLQAQASFTIRPVGRLITALAWSPTERKLAVGGESGVVQMWRVHDAPRLLHSLHGLVSPNGLPGAIQALAFSPDGRRLAASESSETLESPGALPAHYGNRLLSLATWRTSTGNLAVAPHDFGVGPARYTGALAFSPDGRLIAISVPDVGGVPNASDLVLDSQTFKVRHTVHPLGGDDTTSLAFARNGLLATGTQGGIVQLWDPASNTEVAGPVAVAAGPIASIAFDPTARRFATTSSHDGAAKLWYTSTLQQEGMALRTGQDAPSSATFLDDGNRLLVTNNLGHAFTWPTSLAAWEQRACAIAGRNLTRRESEQFLSGRNHVHDCP